jgi:hypothetical protein
VLTESPFPLAYAPARPHPTRDLIPLYRLSRLAASVARTDPVTGEKINKMRRSYEGKVKDLQIAGKNKAVKHEEGKTGMGLEEMAVTWPEEEWQVQKVAGKQVSNGLAPSALERLSRLVGLEPGRVPKGDEWDNLLGVEKARPLQANGDAKARPLAAGPTKPAKANGVIDKAAPAPAASEDSRPKRAGRKRRYDEGSFEGYGEGFVDDDGDADGYSSGTGSRKSSNSKMRRRKVRLAPPPHPKKKEKATGLASELMVLRCRTTILAPLLPPSGLGRTAQACTVALASAPTGDEPQRTRRGASAYSADQQSPFFCSAGLRQGRCRHLPAPLAP